MKKWIWAILPVAVFAAGCENPCEKGVALRNDLVTLETMVNGTIVEPSTMDNSCYQFRTSWNKKLGQGSKFTNKVAHDYFYSEERICERGHYERRCGYYGGPSGPYYPGYPGYPRDDWHRYPNYDCHTVWVCDFVRVNPRKKPGYIQARTVARALLAIRTDLTEACTAHMGNDPVTAIAELASAKARFDATLNNTDYVLTKAGCFDRRRGD